MTTKVLVKQLAGEEDLLLGKGSVTQNRNGTDLPITKVTLFKIVESEAELLAVDTTKFQFAKRIEGGYEYAYAFNGSSWVLIADRLSADLANGTDPTKGAALVGYQRTAPVGYSGTVKDFIDDMPGVNLWEFAGLVTVKPTPDNPATWDWTPAWIAAIATGRKIIVPEGKYRAAAVPFTSNTIIIGAGGRSRKTELCLITAGSSYFLDTSVGNTSQCHISGVYATTEVTGGAFLRKNTRSVYLAYQTYDDIEVSAALEIGFDGFFIFGDWDRCRFGYYGTLGAGGHCAIKSYPATAAQGNQTNLNRVARSQFFRANVQALYIEHGNEWFFDYCDFEQMTGKAIVARGVVGGHLNGCWFERVTGANFVDIAVSAAPQNSGGWSARNCKFIGIGFTGSVFSMDRNSSLLAENNICERMDGAVTFKSGSGIVNYKDNRLVSGTASSATFFSDLNNGSKFIDSQLLLWGRTSCPASKFTNSGFTSIADGASLVGGDNTARFTLSAAANVAYFSLPAKVLDYVKGRRIRIRLMGSMLSASGAETINLYAWDSVTPGFSNSTVGTVLTATTATGVSVAEVAIDVLSGSTSLAFGLRAGGSASGAVFVLEQAAVTIFV